MTTNIFISLMIIFAVLLLGALVCLMYTVIYQKYLLKVLSGKGGGKKLWQPKTIIWIFCALFILASLQCGFQVAAEYGFRSEAAGHSDASFQIIYSYFDENGKADTPKLLGVFDSDSEFVLPPEPQYKAGYNFDGWAAYGAGILNEPYSEAVFSKFAAAGVESIERYGHNLYKELHLYTKWSVRELTALNFEEPYTIGYDDKNGYTDLDFIFDTAIDSQYLLKISDPSASCYIGGNYAHDPGGEYLFYFDDNVNYGAPHGVSIEIVPAANSRGNITVEITVQDYEAYAEYELKAGKTMRLKYLADEVFFGSLTVQNPDIKFEQSGKESNVIGWSAYVGYEGFLTIKNHGSVDAAFRIIPIGAQDVIPNQPLQVNSTANAHFIKLTSHIKGFYVINNAPHGSFSIFDSDFIQQETAFLSSGNNKKGIMMNAGETLYFCLNSDYYGSVHEFLVQSGEIPGLWNVNGDTNTVYRTLKVKRGEVYDLKYITYPDERVRTDMRVSYYGEAYSYVDIDDGIVVIPDNPDITDIYVSGNFFIGGYSLHMIIDD